METRPEMVPMSALDTVASSYLLNIQKYCTAEAWLAIQMVLSAKATQNIWLCVSCEKDLQLFPSIGCDSCLSRYHEKCVGRRKISDKNWYCPACVLKV